jgi:hypothetical protein
VAILPKISGAVWLGPGEFTHEEDRFVTQREARRLFLAAIQEEASCVLAELADEPLALFRPLLERAVDALTEDQRRASHLHVWWSGVLSWNHFTYADPTREPAATELRDRLARWARRWNLDSSADDWIMERALGTLQAWCASPGLFERDGPTWSDDPRSTTFELTRAEQEIAIPPYSWNPQWERKSKARERIASDLKRLVTEQLDRIENVADGRLAKTKKLGSGDAHFRWLVLFQVLDLDWPEVAKRVGRSDPMSVRRDALAIAATVGLTPREGRGRGRPRTRPLRDLRPGQGTGSKIVRRGR